MTTPPRPDRDEYDAALRRIHQRRREAGDDHPLALSEDPREVLAYLRRRGRNGMIRDQTGDDITDALTLRLWLWWEGEDTELWLLEAAETLGRKRLEVGARLGLSTGQSLVDRINRKRAMLGRTPTPAAAPVPATDEDGQIRAVACALMLYRDRMPEEIADDLHIDVLAAALPDWPAGQPAPTAGALNALRFLLGDLDAVTEAGTPLRAVVDLGVQLVGTRSTGPG